MFKDPVTLARARWRPAFPGGAAWDDRLTYAPLGDIYWVDPAGEETLVWMRRVGTPNTWVTSFLPDFSPMTMMTMGIFGDAYFGDNAGFYRKALLPQNKPFVTQPKPYSNTRGAQCKTVNYHKRPASLTRDWWLDRGLIFTADPLGWFEWYCWYWLGRRIPNHDQHQVGRWINFKQRHGEMYRQQPYPGHAQALLHWGIDHTLL
jgi:hypothetical protein